MIFGYGPDVTTATWKGPFSSRDAAIQDARKVYGNTRSFYVTRGESMRIETFVPDQEALAEFLLEELWIAAYQKHGDHADSFPEAADVADNAKFELHAFVKSWVQRRLPNSWAPVGSPERIEPLTQLSLVQQPLQSVNRK
jgi:hypothetical protein